MLSLGFTTIFFPSNAAKLYSAFIPSHIGESLKFLASTRLTRGLICVVALACSGPQFATAQPVSPKSPSVSAPFIAQGLGRATVPVEGTWQFHEGDNMAWAAPSLDDSGWQPIQVGRSWEGQGHRNLTGFAWYRRHVVFNLDRNADWDAALALYDVQDAAEVYWNGQLIGKVGKVWPHAVWRRAGPAQTFILGPVKQLGAGGVLAIRVWAAPYYAFAPDETGGLGGAPLLGDAAAVSALRSLWLYEGIERSLYGYALALLSGLVSLLALLAWLRDRRHWTLVWLAIFTARVPALTWDTLPWNSFRLSYGTVGIIFMAGDAALWLLLLDLFGLRDRPLLVRWTRILAVLIVGLQILQASEQFFDWTRAPHFFLLADIGVTLPCFIILSWSIVLFGFGLRKKLPPPFWALAITGIAADIAMNMASVAGLGGRWTHMNGLAARLDGPLFQIAGNSFSLSTICSTLLLVAIVYAVWRYQRKQRQREVQVAEEFRNAQEVQQVLVPKDLPELQGFKLTAAYRPAQEVGGDFFQLIPLPGGAALLVIGDVSGKGLHAAMTVSLIVGALRTAATTTSDPAEILGVLNHLLHGRVRHGFATCLAMRLDADGKCFAANAGHLPPYCNGGEVNLPAALPLGLVADAQYESVEIQIAPGDRLTLCTDGLPEARTQSGELLGFERTAELLVRCADANQIADAACSFGQEDDITVLTLEMAAVPAMRSR
jgi:hypothetical protein